MIESLSGEEEAGFAEKASKPATMEKLESLNGWRMSATGFCGVLDVVLVLALSFFCFGTFRNGEVEGSGSQKFISQVTCSWNE